jgi:polysaccharide biosynthesis/export protein
MFFEHLDSQSLKSMKTMSPRPAPLLVSSAKQESPATIRIKRREAARSRTGWAVLSFAVLLVVTLALATGCQSSNPGSSRAPMSGEAVTRAASTLHEGDVLRINFEGDTNLNSTVKVQLDGAITLPLVGNVPVAGMTLRELQTDLKQRYQSHLLVDELNVTLLTTSASVYVSGAVLRPGRIPMDRPLTLVEAVMEAGGLTPNRAKPSAVTVLRTEDGQQRHFRVNLQRMLRGEDLTPFYLKPFDVIFVPEKTFNF